MYRNDIAARRGVGTDRARSACVLAAASGVLLLAPPAAASCGSAFCSVNTNWSAQAPLTEPGTRVDVRFEYIDQDQPRRGRHRVGVGELPRHHDEVRTINRNYILTLDHNFDANWGVSVVVPGVGRDHRHVHNHHGGQINEAWDFTELGDVRVLGRYQLNGEHPSNAYGVIAGVKLPTGDFDVANGEGARAERTLQPGSGTTDLLSGAFYTDTLPIPDSGWFAQALFQQPLDERDEFRPGVQLHLDLGYVYQPVERLSLLLQLNTTAKDRDSGRNSEREDSGGWTVALSPGVSYAVLDGASVYGFVQLPVYQYVNGVQLTADWALVLGTSFRF